MCEACANGKQPNVMHTECDLCPAGHAGINGVCDLCTSGSAPSSDLTECLMCNDPNEFDQASHSCECLGPGVCGLRGGSCSRCDEL